MNRGGRSLEAMAAVKRPGFDFKGSGCTLRTKNLLFCRVPINPILGFIIPTKKWFWALKVGLQVYSGGVWVQV